MATQAQCPKCKTNYAVKHEQIGRSATCQKCGSTFTIGRINPTVAVPEKTVKPTVVVPPSATPLIRRPWAIPFLAGAGVGGMAVLLLAGVAAWGLSYLAGTTLGHVAELKKAESKPGPNATTANKASSLDADINSVMQHKFWGQSVTEKDIKAILAEMGNHVEGTLFVSKNGETYWATSNHAAPYAYKEVRKMEDFVCLQLSAHHISMRSDKRQACIILKDAIHNMGVRELNPHFPPRD